MNLQALLDERGITSAELAYACQVKAKAVEAWLSGDAVPLRRNAAAAAQALGVAVADLWPDVEPATHLERALGDRGLTARALATSIGVHENSVYSWASGTRRPGWEHARAAADVLDVRVENLFPSGVDEPQRSAGARLRGWLQRRGVTLTSAATASGLSRRNLSRWVAGEVVPTLDTASRLADALDTEIDDLFDRVSLPGTTRTIRVADVHALAQPVARQTAPNRPDELPSVDDALATPATRERAWVGKAACNTGRHNPDLWWSEQQADIDEARRVCAGCPVLGDCRDAFLARPGTGEGIWAGVRGRDLLAAARRTPSKETSADLTARLARSAARSGAEPPRARALTAGRRR